jgi:hypothetical protein
MLSMHFTPIVQNSKSAPGNRYFGEIRCARLYLRWASSCTRGTIIQDSGKALRSGTVIGTSDTQNLTNKTTDTASKLNGASFGTAAQATARSMRWFAIAGPAAQRDAKNGILAKPSRVF